MKKAWQEIKKVFEKDHIKLSAVFVFLFSFFSIVYFSVNNLISLDDPLFHIRFAEILKERGFSAFSQFHWLYFSKISLNQQYFIYYNFLFYLILLPFTYISPLVLALKLYGIFFASLSFSIFYWFLLKIRIRNSFVWLVLLLSILNYSAIWRFLMARPFTLAPALLIIELYFLYKKKYWGVFFISLMYFYWHTATFFLPLIVAMLFMAFENFYGKKIDWKLAVSSLFGVAIALIGALFFAPGLFHYMKDIIFGVYQDTIIGKKVNISEGVELYPVNFIDYIKTNTIIISFFIIAVVFEIYRYVLEKKNIIGELNKVDRNERPLKGSLFFLSLLFFLGNFLSKRNNDFFLFFSAAYVAVSFDYFINFIKINSAPVRKSLTVGFFVLVFYLFLGNGLFLNDQIASAGPYDSLKGTAEWLKENTNDGDVIFNVTWNWFPALFYYNTHNYYIAGIEPRFLYDYSPEMYWSWWHISNDGFLCLEEKCDTRKSEQVRNLKNDERKKMWYNNEGNAVADSIEKQFKSRYIITSVEFKNFNELMDNSGRFEKVYIDNIYNRFFVYKVK